MGRSVCVFALVNARAPESRELPQPEVPVRKLGMRYGESWLLDALGLEQDDIEVKSAGSPARIAHTPGVSFDPLQLHEEVLRRKLGFYRDHLIEKWSLSHRSNRSGLFGVGLTQHPCPSEGRDRASCLRQKYLTLAEVGAERYVGDILHARSRSSDTSAYAS